MSDGKHQGRQRQKTRMQNFSRKEHKSLAPRAAKSNRQEQDAPPFVYSANLKMNQGSRLDRPISRTQHIVPNQRFARGASRAIPEDKRASREWRGLALIAFLAVAQRHFGVFRRGFESHRYRCLRQPLVCGMPHHAGSTRSQPTPPPTFSSRDEASAVGGALALLRRRAQQARVMLVQRTPCRRAHKDRE